MSDHARDPLPARAVPRQPVGPRGQRGSVGVAAVPVADAPRAGRHLAHPLAGPARGRDRRAARRSGRPTVVPDAAVHVPATPGTTCPISTTGRARQATPTSPSTRSCRCRGRRLLVRWDADLTADQRQVLAKLAELLPYLGRAESVCEARLLDS